MSLGRDAWYSPGNTFLKWAEAPPGPHSTPSPAWGHHLLTLPARSPPTCWTLLCLEDTVLLERDRALFGEDGSFSWLPMAGEREGLRGAAKPPVPSVLRSWGSKLSCHSGSRCGEGVSCQAAQGGHHPPAHSFPARTNTPSPSLWGQGVGDPPVPGSGTPRT